MGHPVGYLRLKKFSISLQILSLAAISILRTKFQLDWMILKNQYGSPRRVSPDQNFTNFTSHSSIRTPYQAMCQISAFYYNFEILVHNTPPTYLTPTGQPVDRFHPSSNSVPNFVQYAYGKNFKSIGQPVRELSKDRQTDRRT